MYKQTHTDTEMPLQILVIYRVKVNIFKAYTTQADSICCGQTITAEPSWVNQQPTHITVLPPDPGYMIHVIIESKQAKPSTG